MTSLACAEREEQRPRSPDGRDNRRLVTPRASLAIIETGRGLVRIISLTRQLIGRRFKVSPFLSLHPISPPRKLGILSNTLAFESQFGARITEHNNIAQLYIIMVREHHYERYSMRDKLQSQGN